MYQVASSQPSFSILRALRAEGKLSTSEIGKRVDREANDLHYYLRKLRRAALVKNRRDPTTGTEQPYSYYSLTDLGELVLTEDLETGIKRIAAEERTIAEESNS